MAKQQSKIFITGEDGKLKFNTNVPPGFNYCTGGIDKGCYDHRTFDEVKTSGFGKINNRPLAPS